MRYIITPENKTYSKVNDDGDRLKILQCFARYEGVDTVKKLQTAFNKWGWHSVINYQFHPTSGEEEHGTILIGAVNKGCEDTVSLIIKNGALIDLPDFLTLRTPLHESVGGGQKTISEILLQNGADPNVIDFTNASPIHMASMRGEADVIKLLVDHGANIEAKTNQQFIPTKNKFYSGQKKSALEIVMGNEFKNIPCMKAIMYLGLHCQERPLPKPVHPMRNREFGTYLDIHNTLKMTHHIEHSSNVPSGYMFVSTMSSDSDSE